MGRPKLYLLMPCQVEGCPDPAVRRYLCERHYFQEYRKAKRRTAVAAEAVRRESDAFLDRVDLPSGFAGLVGHDPGPKCWPWLGRTNADGYGLVRVASGVWRVAHRVSYEHFVGPIPEGLVVDHVCCYFRCVNPAHLDPVSNAENLRRGVSRRTRVGRRGVVQTAGGWTSPYRRRSEDA